MNDLCHRACGGLARTTESQLKALLVQKLEPLQREMEWLDLVTEDFGCQKIDALALDNLAAQPLVAVVAIRFEGFKQLRPIGLC